MTLCRRFLSACLALVIFLGIFPLSVSAASEIAYPVTGGNIYFDATSGTITDCDKYVTEAHIPKEIEGHPVTAIGYNAFAYCRSLRVLTLPETITTIGTSAFISCERLEQFTIPSGVTEIKLSTFEQCQRLKEIVIPAGIVSIGKMAFNCCYNLNKVTLSEGLKSIGHGAFSQCNALTEITIPSSVTKIESSIFGCSEKMMQIHVDPNNSAYSSVDGILFDKEQKTLIEFPYARSGSYTVPQGVTKINKGAFYFCFRLLSVSIPSSVTEIDEAAFSYCHNLCDVYYEGSEQEWDKITIIENVNEYFLAANLHFNKYVPVSGNAYVRSQEITIDGSPVKLQTYALKDKNGYDTNYVMLRDIALLLNGTAAQFEVQWDSENSAINILRSSAYTPTGNEMNTPFTSDRDYTIAYMATLVDGMAIAPTAILLKDDKGGGYTYYQLRDLGRALGFDVSWVHGTGIVIESDQPYTDD